MRQIFRVLSAVLVLLAIALVSALIAMRFAIHGAEVRVPALAGLTVPEAAARLHAKGLEAAIDGRYYSTTQAAGHVVTQSPMPGTEVRKSWRVRLTVSLGPQKTAIPTLEGMNESLAGITIQRTGLQLGDVLSMSDPYAPQDTVVAQTPLGQATDVQGPKVALLTAQPVVSQPQASVMPDFVGEPFTAVALAILHAGFNLAPVGSPVATAPPAQPAAPSGTVVAQEPIAGSRIVAGSTIHLTVQP